MPSPRPRDKIVLESYRGVFEDFEKVAITTDLTDIASIQMTFGDDASWETLAPIVEPGQEFKLSLNGRLIFTGRVEVNDLPVNPTNGTNIDLTCRTKLSDAHYASAPVGIRFGGGEDEPATITLKAFLLALFAPLGYTAADFNFDPNVDRNLITGEQAGKPAILDLEKMTEARAKVQPGETTWEAANRHCQRFHLLIWDGADGRICVGKPDLTQRPTYRFVSKRGPLSVGNNILECKRIRDWSEVPSEISVFANVESSETGDMVALRGTAIDLDAFAVQARNGHFNRALRLPLEGVKNQAKAAAQAKRELAKRLKRKDGWTVKVDGWSHWNGSKLIPYAINTIADLDVDTIGTNGAGRYLIIKCEQILSVEAGAESNLTLVLPAAYDV